MKKITDKINRDNLKKLCSYLEQNKDVLDFDMHYFRAKRDSKYPKFLEETRFISYNDCGTVGCALGWAPFVQGLEAIPEDFFNEIDLDFSSYCRRVFRVELFKDGGVFDFIFGGDWGDVDNTIEGVVYRINYLLNHGLPDNSIWIDDNLELVKFYDLNQ